MKFDGNLLKLQQFWDLFDTTVNSNPLLKDIRKLSFLHGQLCGEAIDDIAGLEVTSASYTVTVDLPMDRYSNKQLMIDAHCSKLRHIPIASHLLEETKKCSWPNQTSYLTDGSPWTKCWKWIYGFAYQIKVTRNKST